MNDEYLADYLKCWYKVYLRDSTKDSRIQANVVSEIMKHLGIAYEVDVK